MQDARRCATTNRDARPSQARVDLVVIHSISLPPGRFGGDAIERLFTNRLDCDAHPYFARLHGLAVSSHFVLRRDGELLQFVGCDERAWHAGRSCWRGRENCNDFSIGIELEGLEGQAFEPAQYTALVRLLLTLRRRYSIDGVAGHEHVAPMRKADPGAGFDWRQLVAALGWPARYFPVGVLSST
ncbi:MAG: 1,6-anhydro-N-acetylmuramyl-L-alanine amidase AmpD [Burkholderiales bacterium]